MLESVINISEGTDSSRLTELVHAAGTSLLDTHSDKFHNRSVFTLYGTDVYEDSLNLVRKAFQLLDLRNHVGVHPRIGVVDVVPFVPFGTSEIGDALLARDNFAKIIAAEYSVPTFLYGPNRTLPQIRREAFVGLAPDFGPSKPHPKFGSVAVGAREPLVAYNIYLAGSDLAEAKDIAKQVRSPFFRTLGLQVGNEVQVSANLIDPFNHGIHEFYEAVIALTHISRCELVGLVPLKVLENSPTALWDILDLDRAKALEIRAADKTSDPPS